MRFKDGSFYNFEHRKRTTFLIVLHDFIEGIHVEPRWFKLIE